MYFKQGERIILKCSKSGIVWSSNTIEDSIYSGRKKRLFE